MWKLRQTTDGDLGSNVTIFWVKGDIMGMATRPKRSDLPFMFVLKANKDKFQVDTSSGPHIRSFAQSGEMPLFEVPNQPLTTSISPRAKRARTTLNRPFMVPRY